jgi:hypothetical protein
MRTAAPLLRARFSRRILLPALVLLSAPVAALTAQINTGPAPSLPPELQSVRAALDKYRDPILAIHDGYLSTLGCIDFPKGGGEGEMKYVPGGMGVHFLNGGLIGPTLDPARPQVLIYEPVGDALHLVAAEWFVPAAAAGDKAPSIFGKTLEGPMEGHKPIMPDGLHHYDLHVWLWKANPAGVYAPTNPTVSCPKGAYSFSDAPPKMVHKGH